MLVERWGLCFLERLLPWPAGKPLSCEACCEVAEVADCGGEVSLGSVGVLSVLEDPNERTFLTLADLERLCLATG